MRLNQNMKPGEKINRRWNHKFRKMITVLAQFCSFNFLCIIFLMSMLLYNVKQSDTKYVCINFLHCKNILAENFLKYAACKVIHRSKFLKQKGKKLNFTNRNFSITQW